VFYIIEYDAHMVPVQSGAVALRYTRDPFALMLECMARRRFIPQWAR
jgi:hypothetical protein